MTETFHPGPEDITLAADETARQHQIWRQANTIKKVSDRWIGWGPVGIGLDTFLAFAPGLGPVYSLGAGGVLIFLALKSKASVPTVLRMAAYMAIDAGTDTVPFLGWGVDALFPGQLMAAKALQRDIEQRFGAPPEAPEKERMVKVKKAKR